MGPLWPSETVQWTRLQEAEEEYRVFQPVGWPGGGQKDWWL
jgi:hypothetical protein